MSETVDNEIRDEVMSNILAKPPNQVCFDCGSKAPKWSSPYLGIVICYECAAKHRSYGTHISFVRSVDLDKWNRKQLKSHTKCDSFNSYYSFLLYILSWQ